MNTQRELASTSMRYPGMNSKARALSRQRTCLRHCRKPTLYSRISLATSRGRGRRCSTATNQFRSSLKPSGSICSVETPLTLTTSSQTSTPYHTTPVMLSSLGKTSNFSMDRQPQPRRLKPMGTGLLPGTARSTLLSSCSDTGSRNCRLTESTFSATLHPCRPSSTAESLTMTEQSGSEQLSDETLNSRISPSLLTCKSNGSITLQDSPPASLQTRPTNLQSPKIRKDKKVDVVLPAEGGMRTGAQTLPLPAITYMSVPNVPTQVMSRVIAPPEALPARNKQPSMRWERRPRFVREYVWSDSESQGTTTASITERIPPVPGLPQNELLDVTKLNVIKNYPHLFHITTPIRVNRFHELLASHPNRPLVESVCEGLRVGFWPWAVTGYYSDVPSIVDNARLQKIRNPEHLRFMEEQRDEEIRLCRFSCAFSTLLPGMTTIPLWVVPKPHSDKLRLVVDHSAGEFSPNSFISPDDAGVHLDTLHALGRALIKVREQYGDVRLVLFKTDVSQAYRRLPVHPLWQLRQVVTINGSHHVDNNNNFGNRGAGRLWVTFFGLVLWIAVVLLLILDLFAYVDDAFSWEFANDVTYYPPYDKLLPTKQARLLTLFDDVGVPHDERKQVSGSPLQIIGFDVDPNSMTITMPAAARDELVSAIRMFANPRQRRSLKDFQRLAGWVNWALNVYPLLRPGLSGVYEKLLSFPKVVDQQHDQ
jgi:hypothetical protein